MGKILSIVVPSYNMESCLEKNLNSLVIVDDLMEYLEVIVINDGSKDKTSDIACLFAEKYPETFKAIDKNNGNYGSCINKGLKEASGTFIKIMDADDLFISENLGVLIKEMIASENNKETVDMFFLDYHTVDENHKILNKFTLDMPSNKVINYKSEKDVDLFHGIQHHAIAYRTELLRRMNYKQTEGVSYTDQEWISIPLFNVERIKYIPIDVYEYLLGREGQTMDTRVIAKAVAPHIVVAQNMVKVYEEIKDAYPQKNQKLVRSIIKRFIKHIYKMFVLVNPSADGYNAIKIFDEKLKITSKEIDREVNNNLFGIRLICRYQLKRILGLR